MSDYKFHPTVGHWLVLIDNEVSTNWASDHKGAVARLHSTAMDNPHKRVRLVQVVAEAERAQPIIHTLMDNRT